MSRSRKQFATTKSDSSERWWRRVSAKRVRAAVRRGLLTGDWEWFPYPRELTNPYSSPKDDYCIWFTPDDPYLEDGEYDKWRRK